MSDSEYESDVSAKESVPPSGAEPASSDLQKNFVNTLSNMVPMLLKIGSKVDDAMDIVVPIIYKGVDAYNKQYEKLKPYNPEALFRMFAGFSMMFFGGFFFSTVAVYEATLQGGFDRIITNLKILKLQADMVKEANEEDDQLDEDNDGVADVKQISKQQLTYRKILVVLKACNPNEVNEALSALYTVLVAVIATLRVRFARTVSLGASIGEQISKPTLKFLLPVLLDVMPKESHKWLQPVLLYMCRIIGVSIAFSLERVLATVHSAVRGAYMMTEGFTNFAESKNMNYLSDGYADDLFSFAMAGMGIYAQLFVWRSLPMLFKVLLFPAFTTEWILSTFISVAV